MENDRALVAIKTGLKRIYVIFCEFHITYC